MAITKLIVWSAALRELGGARWAWVEAVQAQMAEHPDTIREGVGSTPAGPHQHRTNDAHFRRRT